MFEETLRQSFSQKRGSVDKLIVSNSAQHILIMRGRDCGDAVTKDSQVVIYYDFLDKEEPLLIIERISVASLGRKGVSKVKKLCKAEDAKQEEFAVSCKVLKKQGHLDVYLVRNSIVRGGR